MDDVAPVAASNTLLLAVLGPLVGIEIGGGLRGIVGLWAGSDPRHGRLWLAELITVAVLAAGLGFVFTAADTALIGPPFGAALTMYAVSSGAQASRAARRLTLPKKWEWAAAHLGACLLVELIGFAGSVLITGFGSP